MCFGFRTHASLPAFFLISTYSVVPLRTLQKDPSCVPFYNGGNRAQRGRDLPKVSRGKSVAETKATSNIWPSTLSPWDSAA